jgi:hypothetical protein
LHKNPGLRSCLAEAIADAYEIARLEAAARLDIDEDCLLAVCPYPWEEIMGRPIQWPAA